MEIKNNVKTETAYVISADGLRVPYDEWLEMRRAEMDR